MNFVATRRISQPFLCCLATACKECGSLIEFCMKTSCKVSSPLLGSHDAKMDLSRAIARQNDAFEISFKAVHKHEIE